MSKKRLVVIDGKAVFYRGYYAMPNLTLKDGTPVGGVYGFAVMALEAFKKMKPDYICVAWDKPKTNIRRRREIYPEYKANRKPAPPDFYLQLPILMDLLKAFNIPLYEIDDHEADDIMGTFSVQARQKGFESIMVTGDHDLLQTVRDDTVVAILKKGLTNIDYFDPERFEAVYEMTPQEFVDYKSMRGDSSDNIPGIAGVGEKTAKQLIKQHHSIEEIYKHLDEMTPKQREKFENGREAVAIARQLVTLDFDVPIQINWEDASISNVDPSAVAAKLRELEFRSLLKQLPDSMMVDGLAAPPQEMHTFDDGGMEHTRISDAKELSSISRTTAEPAMYVVSKDSLGKEPIVVLLSTSKKQVYSLELSSKLTINQVATYLKGGAWISYQAKLPLKVFMHTDQPLKAISHDVRMAAFLLNPLAREQSLWQLAQDQLGYMGSDFENIPSEEVADHAVPIMSSIWQLYDLQKKALQDQPKVALLAKQVEWPILKVLAKMEVAGISLDTKYLKTMSESLQDTISDLEQNIYGLADEEFNISSPAQLAQILFEKLLLPTKFIKKTKTTYSTAASELRKLKDVHPIINLISAYREVTKLKSTYVDSLPELVDDQSKLHTTFAVDVAPTGRLSSHDPNLQNIPVRTELGKQIRSAFVADTGMTFISADYSQFELRIAAALSGEQTMIEAFNRDVDIHTLTAAQIHNKSAAEVTKQERYSAKAVNFGIMYGQGPHGLSEGTGMSMAEAKDFIERYFEIRPALKAYIERLRLQAKEQGYVETILGRRRPTPDAKSGNFAVRQAAERAAINMPVQGSAADLTKLAMIAVDELLPDGAKQILQIHDSIMVEAPKDQAEAIAKTMKQTMEDIYPELGIKLLVDVSIGDNWGKL